MDVGCSLLIKALLQDGDLQNVLVVLAYRDEELNAKIDDLVQDIDEVRIVDIALTGLDVSGVQGLITTVIGHGFQDEDSQLSQVVWQKTKGNCFHVLQFLELILAEGMLTCKAGTFAPNWVYDVDMIQRQVLIADGLADLLSRKIFRMDVYLREALGVAAVIGFRFTTDILYHVMVRVGLLLHRPTQEEKQSVPNLEFASKTLARAVDETFIEKTKDGYQFSHDKVRSAFLARITEAEEERLHLVIGKTYLDLEVCGPEANFQATQHLNIASALLDRTERLQLAEHNLEAARHCNEKSAFLSASNHLRFGLGLLGTNDEKWTDHFALAFEMTEDLAKMELINGNYDICRQLTQDTLSHATTSRMKLASLLVNVEVCAAKNEAEQGIRTSRVAIRALGQTIPEKVGLHHLAFKVSKVKRLIGRKSDEDILNLPIVHDEQLIAILRILNLMAWCCILQDDEISGVYASLLATELTLTRGLTKHAASAISMYAMVELGLGNRKVASRFSALALQMIDRFLHRDTEVATIMISIPLVSHWEVPMVDLIEPLGRGVSSALDCGDYLLGSICLMQNYSMKFHSGSVSIPEIYQFYRQNYDHLCELGGDDPRLSLMKPSLQLLLNMMNPKRWEELTILTGDAMNEVDLLREANANNHAMLKVAIIGTKSQLAFHFGLHSLAEKYLVEVEHIGKAKRFDISWIFGQLTGALIYYQLYRETGHRRYRRRARKYKRALRPIEARGCPNVAGAVAFLDAEELSIRYPAGDSPSVVSSYWNAIRISQGLNCFYLEAMINERLAFYLCRRRDALVRDALATRDEARACFDRALEVYRDDWGAYSKYEWLKQASARALPILRSPFPRAQPQVGLQIICQTGDPGESR